MAAVKTTRDKGIDYGEDVSTHVNGGLDPNFRTITGPIVILEAVVRRWNVARGTMWWDPNAGEDFSRYLNAKLDDGATWALQVALESEALKDERVKDCDVQIRLLGRKTLQVFGTITPSEGPKFSFIFDPATLTLELLRSIQP